jgi:LemA protein
VLAVLLVLFVLGYNRLVRLRNRMQTSWAQVDVQLKRRYDLVPNLVEVVKGYAQHERATLENVAAARAEAVRADGVAPQARAESSLTDALSHLLAVAERYPELRASQGFLDLQHSLVETENRIAIARQVYNDTVQTYENARQQLPTNVIAVLFGFKPRSFFELQLGSVEREPVQITT